MLSTRRRRESRARTISSRSPIPTLAAACLLLAALAPASDAAPGLYMSWNDCSLSAASLSSLMGPCLDSSREELVLSFELPASTDSVIRLDAVVDVQSAATVLPAWWAYQPSGCRFGQLIASADFTGLSACTDFWVGGATFDGPPVYSPGAPHLGTNQARIGITFAVLSNDARALSGATRYYAARLVFQNEPTGGCAGCDVPACLLFNSIRIVRLRGSPATDLWLDAPGAPDSNRATWQSSSADCSMVPVRRRTWGQLKTLYR